MVEQVERRKELIGKTAEALGWDYERFPYTEETKHRVRARLIYLSKIKRSGLEFPICLDPSSPIECLNEIIVSLDNGAVMLGAPKDGSDRGEIREYLVELRSKLQEVVKG